MQQQQQQQQQQQHTTATTATPMVTPPPPPPPLFVRSCPLVSSGRPISASRFSKLSSANRKREHAPLQEGGGGGGGGRSRSGPPVPPPPPPFRAIGARTEIESGRHHPGTGPGTEPHTTPKDKQGGGTPEGQQKKIISEEIKRRMEANRLNAYFIRKAKAAAAEAAEAAEAAAPAAG